MTSRQRWTLLAAIIGSGIVFLDGTIVNVALPRIGQELPATVVGVFEGQTYVAIGYLATLAALLILAGALSDHYGRRRTYVIGLAGFGVMSALCGLAPNLEALILFRLLQGAAGALLVPGSLSLISQAFGDADRPAAIGRWASATSALVLLGPIVGGLLVDTVGWRVAFLVNVPFIAVALWATLTHVEESRDTEAAAGFDWLGAVVATLAVGGLAFGLIRGQQEGWTDTTAWVSLGVGVVSLVLFPILMTTRPNPLVPLGLFRSRRFATVNLATFFIYGALYGNFGYQALALQNVIGYSALAAGTVGLPSGLMLTLLSARFGAIAGRRGARAFLVVGPLLMAAGTLWFARLPVDSPAWVAAIDTPASLIPPPGVWIDVLPAILLSGLGISLIVAPLTATLMSSMPMRYSGLGSAINNAISRVGYPLLGAFTFIAVSATFYAALGSAAPELDTSTAAVRDAFSPLYPPVGATPTQAAAAARASMDAFHLSMLVSAGLLVIGSAVGFVGLRGTGAIARAESGASTRSAPGS
ncbi:MAG: MFS transporter [Candidatus Limnocylindrales bacterium]